MSRNLVTIAVVASTLLGAKTDLSAQEIDYNRAERFQRVRIRIQLRDLIGQLREGIA